MNKLTLAAAAALSAITVASATQPPVQVRWEMGRNGAQKGYYLSLIHI